MVLGEAGTAIMLPVDIAEQESWQITCFLNDAIAWVHIKFSHIFVVLRILYVASYFLP